MRMTNITDSGGNGARGARDNGSPYFAAAAAETSLTFWEIAGLVIAAALTLSPLAAVFMLTER
jgi:hypothetical protein